MYSAELKGFFPGPQAGGQWYKHSKLKTKQVKMYLLIESQNRTV